MSYRISAKPPSTKPSFFWERLKQFWEMIMKGFPWLLSGAACGLALTFVSWLIYDTNEATRVRDQVQQENAERRRDECRTSGRSRHETGYGRYGEILGECWDR